VQYGLLPKQADLLAFIKKHMAESGGIAPSYDEMLAGTGHVSKSTISRLLKGLQERGYIGQLHNRRRSIVLLEAEK
jgi:SOS-response transcriptional repressor LexA